VVLGHILTSGKLGHWNSEEEGNRTKKVIMNPSLSLKSIENITTLCIACCVLISVLCSHLLHICVDRPSSFRVFDREAEGKAYESVNQHFLTGADVNIIGQPKLHFEPQVRHCPKYTHVLHGNIRVMFLFCSTAGLVCMVC